MELLLGPIVAIAASFGFTYAKCRSCDAKFKQLEERIERISTDVPHNVLAAVYPVSQSVKQLQEFTGMR